MLEPLLTIKPPLPFIITHDCVISLTSTLYLFSIYFDFAYAALQDQRAINFPLCVDSDRVIHHTHGARFSDCLRQRALVFLYPSLQPGIDLSGDTGKIII